MDSLLLSLSPTCTFYITSYTSTASAAVQRSPPCFLTYKRKTPSSDCSSSRLDSCLVNTRGRGGLRLPRQLLSLVARVLGAVRSIPHPLPRPSLCLSAVPGGCLSRPSSRWTGPSTNHTQLEAKQLEQSHAGGKGEDGNLGVMRVASKEGNSSVESIVRFLCLW